jgi:hypothetical protein
MSKTDLWDRLGKTDPRHTKGFSRSGGFKGTAIKPMYSFHRMTEEFGPCGQGWGVNQPSFQVVPGTEGEVLVYCTVSVWHGDRANLVFGVGGDKVVVKYSSGLKSDDEAFKKAFTDAITNALKLIGVGADVHMGLFDDSKYVNDLKQEIAWKAEVAVIEKVQEAVTLVERNSFMVECRDAIAQFEDPDQLAAWWSSDAQKKARREYQLDQSQVDTLKVAVMDRRKVLQKVAA